METSHRISPVVVMAALIAGIVALKSSAPLSWVGTVSGVTILLVLFSFDEQGRRSFLQSMAFGLACGLGLMLAAGGVVNVIRGNGDAKFDPLSDGVLCLIWAGAGALFVMLDRIRMSNRVDEAEQDAPKTAMRAQSTSLPGYTSLGSVTPVSAPAPAPAYYPPPAPQPRPALQQPTYQQPAYQPPAPAPPPQPAYEPPPPAYEPPPPAPAPPPQAAPEPQYVPPPPPPPQPQYAPPQQYAPQQQYAPPAPPPPQQYAPPPPKGKEAMIYVGMVDQGLSVLRSVRAVEVGKNYFQIVEERPANEAWQFTTGQVVKCEKKNLSTGKGWVAVEEAPRR